MEHQIEHRMEVPSGRGVSRIGVLDGPTGRRRWSDDLKARIVAERLLPAARVCDVAAKYRLIARHLSQWRGLARQGKLVLPYADGGIGKSRFVDVVVPCCDRELTCDEDRASPTAVFHDFHGLLNGQNFLRIFGNVRNLRNLRG